MPGLSGVDSNEFDHSFSIAADASYYAGGPLAAAPVECQVRTQPATYAPPGWNQFTFGIWTPWWQVDDVAGGGPKYGGRGSSAPAGGPVSDCCGQYQPDS